MRKVYGLAGPAGCGKDTAANYLREKGFVTYSFATPLKCMLAVAGWPEPESRLAKELQVQGFDFTWRQAAQTLGTEWGRALDPDIWLKLGKQNCEAESRDFVFTDTRFENEASMIREVGGHVLHIAGRSATLQGDTAAHISERGLDFVEGVDFKVDNSSTLESLHAQLDTIMATSKR